MLHNGESFLIKGSVLRIFFTISYGQQITQFINVALLCWTVNNSMVLFFKVHVGQWLTQVIFYCVLGREYRLLSFKTWIFLLNVCFFFWDGVRSSPRIVLLMFLFSSFCLGVSTKSWYKISNELCKISQFKKVIMYLNAFVRIWK